MKPWQINALIIAGMVLIILFLPFKTARLTSLAIATVSAVWVYYDATKLKMEKYSKTER